MGVGSRDINVTASTNPAHNPALTEGKEKRRARWATSWRESNNLHEDRAYDLDLNDFTHLKWAHPPVEQYITWTNTIQCPTVEAHTPHCIQEFTAYNEQVVYNGSYRLVASYNTHKGNIGWIIFPKIPEKY